MSQHLRVIVGLLDDLTLKNMDTRLANWILKRCPHPLPAAQPLCNWIEPTAYSQPKWE